MNPVLAIVLGWCLFSGSHFLLSSEPLRSRLVSNLGERAFINVFSAVAALTFTVFCASAALYHEQGPPGPALAGVPLVRGAAIGAIFLGFALMAGSLADYGRSPFSPAHRVPQPRGVAVISRHAFFYGLAFWALAHVLLASTLSAALFFAGLAFQAVLGAWLQDRKLRRRLGTSYQDYLAQTSAFPFAAIAMGKARLHLNDLPWLAFGVGFALAGLLRQVHAHVFDFYGLYIVAAVLGGAGFALWTAERREQALRREPLHG